jgi:hypothetical protein
MIKTIKEKLQEKTKEETKQVVINPLVIATMKFRIVGLTPLLLNKMSEKEKQLMLDKQMGKGTEKNKIRNPIDEVENKIHKMSGNRVGIPIDSIKNALIESAPSLDLYKKQVTGSLFIIPEENNLVPITYKKMVTNESITRDGNQARTPRTTFRPQFNDWSCEFVIRYNAKAITPDIIVNLLKVAGFSNGLGAWRPATKGSYGMFEVK